MVDYIKFVNSRFTSNTYIIFHSEYEDVWVVDPGDSIDVFNWIDSHSKSTVSGILLTHAHFDHIYGINDILVKNPDCPIYIANQYGEELLHDAKKNGSRYTEEGPIIIDEMAHLCYYEHPLSLWPDTRVEFWYTPGHSDDSLCIMVGNLLFTGDTLIKEARTVTKLKSGSVEKLKNTIELLQSLKGHHLVACPGHGEVFSLDEYDLNKALTKQMVEV